MPSARVQGTHELSVWECRGHSPLQGFEISMNSEIGSAEGVALCRGSGCPRKPLFISFAACGGKYQVDDAREIKHNKEDYKWHSL